MAFRLAPAALVYLVHLRRPRLGDNILGGEPHMIMIVVRQGLEP